MMPVARQKGTMSEMSLLFRQRSHAGADAKTRRRGAMFLVSRPGYVRIGMTGFAKDQISECRRLSLVFPHKFTRTASVATGARVVAVTRASVAL